MKQLVNKLQLNGSYDGMFPSPCGVFGMKRFDIEVPSAVEVVHSFRPLAGCLAWNLISKNNNTATNGSNGFPSPCGVFGMKLHLLLAQAMETAMERVSVPLRGVWHETNDGRVFGGYVVSSFRPLAGCLAWNEAFGIMPKEKYYSFVSVPLRGVWHETPHIFEAYTVKLLTGSISIGHLHSQ